MSRHPIAALRANDYCYLGIHRALAEAGVEGRRGVSFSWPGAGPWYSEHSPHVRDAGTIPNPYSDPAAAASALASLGQRWRAESGERSLAIPSSDTNLMLLLDHYDELSSGFRLMGDRDFDADPSAMVHKGSAAELMARAGVPIPVTIACRTHADIEICVEQVPYPCIYKPAVKDYGQSFYAAHDGMKAIECKTPEALRSRLPDEIARGFELVVQERVDFDSVYDEIPFYTYVDRNQRVRMASSGIKELIQPFPSGTATVLRFAYHPELLEPAERVARALGYRGILMIEFIRDKKDGVWKVIEVNTRPWLCIDFYRRCGMNYLRALDADLNGELDDEQKWPALETPRADVLASDPVHILLPSAIDPVLAGLGRAARIEDVTDWLRKIPGTRSLAFLDPRDPEPGRRELADFAAKWQLDERSLLRAVESELGDV